jgi:hypothetical protein
MVSGDLKVKLALTVIVGGAAAYLVYRLVKGLPGLGVLKDGADAAAQLAKLAANMVTSPLDTFGITPGTYKDGTPTWQKTTPWDQPVYIATPPLNPDLSSVDPVSNNNQGINYNLF